MKFCFYKKDFIEHTINPTKLALIDASREINWLEFESEVNSLIHFLKEQNWTELSNPVILYGHKQAEMIIAMYALMKLNIAYIPLDVIYPIERVAKIAQIAEVDVILNFTNKALAFENTNEVFIDSNSINIQSNATKANLRTQLNADPLVYIIFTSGSTGEPKGVQITTKAIQTFKEWMCNDFGFSSNDVFINIAVFSFDLSVFEVMTFAGLGASLLLNDKAISENSELLMNRVKKHNGTVWVSTPSFAFAYTRIGADPRLDSLRYFLFCGETLPHPIASNLKKLFPQAKVFNTYGPTEATVATTIIEIDSTILEKYNPLPVGYPKRDCEIQIHKENEDEKLGELVIVGDHVSIGYFKNKELNEAKFLTINGKRAFKTGDLAYYQDNMVFVSGRNDDQIKFNGFRIELNEITNVLLKHELVAEATTIGLRRNNEVKKIISFIIPKMEITGDEIKNEILPFIKTMMPHYMIPGDIVISKTFPYNTNFKIDKKKLESEYLSNL